MLRNCSSVVFRKKQSWIGGGKKVRYSVHDEIITEEICKGEVKEKATAILKSVLVFLFVNYNFVRNNDDNDKYEFLRFVLYYFFWL